MSALAGFDMCFELTADALLRLMQDAVNIQGVVPFPQFELKATQTGGSSLLAFDGIFDSVSISLNVGADTGVLSFHIIAGQVTLPGAPLVPLSDGNVRVNFQIVQGVPFQVILQSAALDVPATQQVQSIPNFFSQINQILTGLLDPSKKFDLFPNGTVNYGIPFGLEVTKVLCFDSSTVMLFFGANGIVSQKTKSLAAGYDLSAAYSADRLRQTIFYPGEIYNYSADDIVALLPITKKQATDLLNDPTVSFIGDLKPFLPAPFGTGQFKEHKDGTDIFINWLDFVFHDGYVEMDGKFNGGGTCFSVDNGVFTETLAVSVANGAISTSYSPNPPQPTYDVSVDFLCSLITAVLGGTIEGTIGAIAAVIGVGIYASTYQPELRQIPKGHGTPLQIDFTTWADVGILQEGGVLQGHMAIPYRPSNDLTTIDFFQTGVVTDQRDLGSGVYGFPGTPSCAPRDFTFEHYGQDSVISLQAESFYLVEPVQYSWTVDGQPVTGSGTLHLTKTVVTAIPPLNGTALYGHQVRLGYQVGIRSGPPWVDPSGFLQLSARAADYNYSVSVELKGVDVAGRAFFFKNFVKVTGDLVQFGPDYQAYMAQCALQTMGAIAKLRTFPEGVPRDGRPLTDEQIVLVVQEAVNAGAPADAVAALRQIAVTRGVGIFGQMGATQVTGATGGATVRSR
jgi:hypothetical protein